MADQKPLFKTPYDIKDVSALFSIVAIVLIIAAIVGNNLFGIFQDSVNFGQIFQKKLRLLFLWDLESLEDLPNYLFFFKKLLNVLQIDFETSLEIPIKDERKTKGR